VLLRDELRFYRGYKMILFNKGLLEKTKSFCKIVPYFYVLHN